MRLRILLLSTAIKMETRTSPHTYPHACLSSRCCYLYRYHVGGSGDSIPNVENILSPELVPLNLGRSPSLKGRLSPKEFKMKTSSPKRVSEFKTFQNKIISKESEVDFLFFGNCQALTCAYLVDVSSKYSAIRVLLTPNTIEEIKSGEQDFSQLIAKCKRVVLQLPINSERNKMILPALEGHSVKRVYSLTEVFDDNENKIKQDQAAAFTAVQD